MAKTIDSQAIMAVYRTTTTEEVEGPYDGWAARHDRECAELGFGLPSLIGEPDLFTRIFVFEVR